MSASLTEFRRVDEVLNQYYQSLGVYDYISQDDGIGRFERCATAQGWNETSIAAYLGEYCGYDSCKYFRHGMFDHDFPFPSYASFSSEIEKTKFMFYITRYCYNHNQPPTKYCMLSISI